MMLGDDQPELVLEQRNAAQTRFLDRGGDDADIAFALIDCRDDFMRSSGDQLQLGRRIFIHIGIHKRGQCRLKRC
ncbi:hypothetical protein D3C73_1354790 [compost metagenome]